MRRYTVVVDGTPFTIDVEETASDRFEVTVDGRTFEASLEADEDLPGAAISPELPMPADAHAHAEIPFSAVPVTPVAAAPPQGPALPPRTHAPTPGVAAGSRGEMLGAPMPGVVLEVHVRPGATLKRGDPVLVLEAMKMRNTIRAPRAAVVVSVEVEPGQPVGAGDPLVRLGPAAG